MVVKRWKYVFFEKNNNKSLFKEKKPKYKIRKLSIGVVSFMFGFYYCIGGQVSAESSLVDLDNNIDKSLNSSTIYVDKEENKENNINKSTTVFRMAADTVPTYSQSIQIKNDKGIFSGDSLTLRMKKGTITRDYTINKDEYGNYVGTIDSIINFNTQEIFSRDNAIQIITTPDKNYINGILRNDVFSVTKLNNNNIDFIVENDNKIFDNNYNIFSFTITNKRISPFGILSVYLEYEKLPGYENVNLPENKIIFSQMGINMNSCFYFEVPYGAKVTIKGLENTNSPEIIKFTDINKNGTFNIKTRNLGPNIISNTSYMYMNMPDGIKNADATSNEGSPSVSSVTYSSDKDKEFMRNEILNAVTFPNNRGIKIDKSIEGSIPTKPSEEAVEVPILLTYQDGSKRIVKVPVIVTKQTQAQKDTALTATEVRYKTNATEQEIEEKIKEAVSTTTQGITIENKEIIGKIPDAYTNGQAENVEVKVTYADKSTKTIQVPVVVLQTDAQKYKPTVSGNVSVNKDKVSDQETVEEILGKVEVAKGAVHVDKEIKGTVPNTVGEHNVIVEVTYADGTKAEATVVVNVTEDSREKSFSGGSKRTHNSKKDGKVIKKIDFKNYTNRHFAYMFGYPDGKVRPNREITRAELAAIVVRLEGLDSSDNLKPKFNDTGSNWYNGVINAVS